MRTRAWRMAGWLVLALCLAGCVRDRPAQVPASTARPIADLPAWKHYLAAAAVADRIVDPVARCVAYPDLPGNAWTVDAARARCQLLREPPMTLEDIASLLARRDGAQSLDARFRALLDAHYADPRMRELIFTAYAPFHSGDAGQAAAETWLARVPGSAFAQTAVGSLHVAAAIRARGGEVTGKTPDGQLQTMSRRFGQAVPLLVAALHTEPRLSVACEQLMEVGRWSGDTVLLRASTDHCIGVDPLSWNVRHEWQRGLDPRWGGSIAAIDASVDTLRALAPQNPALGAMLSRAVGTAAYLPTLEGRASRASSSAGFEEAARLAPDAVYIGEAGLAAQESGDQLKALGYLVQATRLAPEEARFIAARGEARRLTGDPDGAISDARRAIALGSDAWVQTVLGQALIARGRVAEARPAFEAAMQDALYRQWSFRQWCETFLRDPFDRDGATHCTEGLVAEYPDDARSLYMRAWVLYRTGDAGANDVADAFAHRADRQAPADQRMLAELARARREATLQ